MLPGSNAWNMIARTQTVHGTTPNQRTVTGTLTTLPAIAESAGLKAPTLIIVGEVVRLKDKLAWFETNRT